MTKYSKEQRKKKLTFLSLCRCIENQYLSVAYQFREYNQNCASVGQYSVQTILYTNGWSGYHKSSTKIKM